MSDTVSNLSHGVDFQRAVLRLMILDRGFCSKSIEFLKEGFFTGELSWFFRKIKDYYSTFKLTISSAELQSECFKHGDPVEIRKYEDERLRIVETDVSKDRIFNPDYIKRELTGFIRANIFVGSYQEAASIFNAGNKQSAFEFTKDKLDSLLNVDFEREQTIDCGDYRAILTEAAAQRTKAIPTGIHAIDSAMGGGLLPQTWTTFLGGSNVGKCLAHDSLVSSSRGLIPISQIKVGDGVFGMDGFRSVLGVHNNGEKHVWKMTLRNGFSLESTLNHVHAIMGDLGQTEKKLSDIKIGDLAVLPSCQWIDGVLTWFVSFSPVVSVEDAGIKETFDLSVDKDNLFVAGGILTHNSMLCPNLAYSAVMAGKKVFVTVHEDEVNPTIIRYLSRFTGIKMDRLTLPESLRTKEEEMALAGVSALIKDKIKLRFMYGQECFVERIEDVLYQQHDQWEFDLFLCDYGQCLKSKAFKNMDNSYSVQEYVYSELKQICLALNIAGAGGAQVNRQGHKTNQSGADFLRMTDVGDCLARGTLVLTRRGYRPIEMVKEGDMVLTHLGRWKRVAGVMNKGLRETWKVKFDGLPSLRCTPNHPFWVNRRTGLGKSAKRQMGWTAPENFELRRIKKDSCSVPRPHFGDKSVLCLKDVMSPEWVSSLRERNKDRRSVGKIPSKWEITPSKAWVLGLYLAEGCIGFRDGKAESIRFAVHKKETDYIRRIYSFFEEFGCSVSCAPKRTNGISIDIYNARLAEIFNELFGKYSTGKKIPDPVWDWSPELICEFLQGLQAGDGDHTWKMNFSLSNPLLVSDLSALAFSVFGEDYLLTETKVKKNYSGLAKKCSKNPPSPYRTFRQTRGTGRSHGFVENGYLFKPLKEIQKDNLMVECWDLAVEDDHSFVVDGGIAVHNSWGVCKKSSNVITMNRSEEDKALNRITFLLDKVRHGRCPVAVQCVTDYSKAIVYDQDPLMQVEVSVADGPSASSAAAK